MLSSMVSSVLCFFRSLGQSLAKSDSYQYKLENYLSRRSITDSAQLEVYMREFIYDSSKDATVK